MTSFGITSFSMHFVLAPRQDTPSEEECKKFASDITKLAQKALGWATGYTAQRPTSYAKLIFLSACITQTKKYPVGVWQIPDPITSGVQPYAVLEANTDRHPYKVVEIEFEIDTPVTTQQLEAFENWAATLAMAAIPFFEKDITSVGVHLTLDGYVRNHN